MHQQLKKKKIKNMQREKMHSNHSHQNNKNVYLKINRYTYEQLKVNLLISYQC